MAKELHILEEAIDEGRSAYEWYAERSERAAQRFQEELDLAIQRICENPESHSIYVHSTRCYQLRRFPYLVVYRETESAIQVIAIAHGHRREGYWRKRTT